MAWASRNKTEAIDAGADSDDLVDALARFHDDPLGFVMFAFPWNEEGTLLAPRQVAGMGHNGGPRLEEAKAGPDTWQIEFLNDLGQQIRARRLDPNLGSIRLARVSGHGIGKTTLTAWIILWFMSCRSHPIITVTANTAGQLKSTTWRELAKWKRLAINGSWFEWNATTFRHKAFPETWVATATPWSANNAEAFAGRHEENLMLLFDEASGIDDIIWETAEGQMSTANAVWLAFGNGTQNTGRFYDLGGRFRKTWSVAAVDSREAKMSNKAEIDRWLEDYGEDSDFFRVRVRGMFPRASSTQLIGTDLIEGAQARFKRAYGRDFRTRLRMEGLAVLRETLHEQSPGSPVIMTVDVARLGNDESVISVRCGNVFIKLQSWRELTTDVLAKIVAEHIDAIQPEAVFIDGVGIGGPAIDILRSLQYEIEDVQAGAKAMNDRAHYNKRAEMYVSARDWLRSGGMIEPEDLELATDLREVQYGFAGRTQALQLETKDDARRRGVASPDVGDTLAYSFWMPVARRRTTQETVAERIARQIAGHETASTSWMSN